MALPSPGITADDLDRELEALGAYLERFPPFRILVEQAPPDDFDPQDPALDIETDG